TAPAGLRPGTPVVLAAKAAWLVCSDVCIPEDANLELKLPAAAAAGAVDPAAAALFAAARSDVPGAAPAATSARIQNGRLVIALGKDWGATLPQIKSLAFFPYDEGGIEYAAAQILTRGRNGMELAMQLGDAPPKAGLIRGVLVATEQSGGDTVTVPMEIAADFSAGAQRGPTGKPAHAAVGAAASGQGHASLPALLLLAILGGLILNLMPCVFPVLSIKALGLVEQAKKHPAAVRA